MYIDLLVPLIAITNLIYKTSFGWCQVIEQQESDKTLEIKRTDKHSLKPCQSAAREISVARRLKCSRICFK